MYSFFIFIVVLGILIFFHELGHFLFARLFDVGVEKFSLGFGPRILGRTVGRTDYRVSLIPLGGYVKMVGDEPDAELPPEDLPFSFTHKHVAQRALIVAAGPFFNGLLTILLYIGIFFFAGLPSSQPYLRDVAPDSPASKAGLQKNDLVTAIDSTATKSWIDIQKILDANKGEKLTMTIKRHGKKENFEITPEVVTVKDFFGDDIPTYELGISEVAELQAKIDIVVEGMPAQKAGLKKGDQIIAIDGQAVDSWEIMQQLVSQSKGKALTFKVLREGQSFETTIQPKMIQEKDISGIKQSAYRIGISAPAMTVPAHEKITIRLTATESFKLGVGQTWKLAKITVYFFGKLFQGKVPMEYISGPVRIAQMARKQADEGLVRLLNFIAFVSIQLAILNLLPIPVLDGGHLLFFGIEAVIRRPVSIRTRETAQQIGVILLIFFMIFVLYNDIALTWFN